MIEIDGRKVCSDGEECSGDTVRYYSSSSPGVSFFNECCAPDLLSDSIDGLQVCNCSGTVYCSEYSGNKCQKVSCCSSGTPVRISETVGTCCAGTIKNLADFDYGLCCTNATDQPYCFDYQDGRCVSAGCCRGTPYCINYNFDGQCISSTCRSGSTCTPYRKSLFQGDCCEPGYIVKTVENGMEACCYASFDAYCSEETNGLCSEASCCNGEVYQKTLTEKGCCESGYKVSHFGSGIDACCSSRYTAYCGNYNAQGECISAYCSSSCTPYRVSATSGACCSSSKVVKSLSNGYEICCNATDEVYWNGSSSACCTSDKIVTKENFDGAQACVVADYTTAYCSSYVNGLCNRVAVSYISGGCTPYRKSETEGGCCAGAIISNGQYQKCMQ